MCLKKNVKLYTVCIQALSTLHTYVNTYIHVHRIRPQIFFNVHTYNIRWIIHYAHVEFNLVLSVKIDCNFTFLQAQLSNLSTFVHFISTTYVLHTTAVKYICTTCIHTSCMNPESYLKITKIEMSKLHDVSSHVTKSAL